MKKHRLHSYRLLSPALTELTEAAEFYDERVPGLGADFVDEADAAIDRILKYPEAWRKFSEDYRHTGTATLEGFRTLSSTLTTRYLS